MPAPDLAALWDEHCRYEFEPATWARPWRPWWRPYVNHVPTMTGGFGHDQLARFYAYHFIGPNTADTKLIPIAAPWARTGRGRDAVLLHPRA